MRTNAAIEVSERYLKMAIARPQPPHPKLMDCIVEPIDSLPDEQITKKFQDFARSAKIKPGFLTLSLARNLVTVRNLHLPSHEKKEIIQMIDLNMARIVPYKKDEIVFGYRQLGTDDMGYAKVILAIVHNNTVRRHFAILEKAGLLIDKVSLSSCGVWEWAMGSCRPEINPGALYLLLDVEYDYVDFIIFSHNAVLFTRSINIGARSIHEDGQPGITKLLGEVKQLLVMFYNEETSKKPAAVFISGANVKTELNRLIEVELGMPLKIVPNPVTPEILKSKGRALPPDTSVTSVCAMALRDTDSRINFILPEIQIRRSLREKTREIIIIGSIAIYLFMVICGLFLGKISGQQSYLNKLNKDYEESEGGMKDILAQLDKIAFVSAYLGKRGLPLDVFYELETNISSEVVVNAVTIDEKDGVSVRGQAFGLSDVFKFVNALEKVKGFKDVQAKSTRKKKVKDKELTEFEITLIYEITGKDK